MAQSGVLRKDARVELIEGEVIEMSPIGKRHAACVLRLNRLLNRKVDDLAFVSVQSPIGIDDFSEPQPDLALLKPSSDFYANSHPAPHDLLVVIEVSDTSLDYDRNVKLTLYARAGIPEALLVVLPKDVVEVYTDPKNGKYTRVQRLKRVKTVNPQLCRAFRSKLMKFSDSKPRFPRLPRVITLKASSPLIV